MTKKIIEAVMEDVKSSLDCYTLKEVRQKLDEWIKKYGENTRFDIGQECEDYGIHEYAYVRLIGKREETDKEYASRVELEERRKQSQEQRDQAEFARLKAKFEGA